MKIVGLNYFATDNAEMVMYHLLHLQIQDFLISCIVNLSG